MTVSSTARLVESALVARGASRMAIRQGMTLVASVGAVIPPSQAAPIITCNYCQCSIIVHGRPARLQAAGHLGFALAQAPWQVIGTLSVPSSRHSSPPAQGLGTSCSHRSAGLPHRPRARCCSTTSPIRFALAKH